MAPLMTAPLPVVIELEPVVFRRCFLARQRMLCVTPAQAKSIIRNKIKVAGWMFGGNNALVYYSGYGHPDPGLAK